MHVCLSSQVFLIVDDCAQVKLNPHIVREETHGGGELIQIAAAQLRGVHGMWGITRSRINVKSSDDLTWESGGAKTPMDNPDRYRGPGIPYLLYDIGGEHSDAPWRGAQGNWQRVRQCGCTWCTGMSSTPW